MQLSDPAAVDAELAELAAETASQTPTVLLGQPGGGQGGAGFGGGE